MQPINFREYDSQNIERPVPESQQGKEQKGVVSQVAAKYLSGILINSPKIVNTGKQYNEILSISEEEDLTCLKNMIQNHHPDWEVVFYPQGKRTQIIINKANPPFEFSPEGPGFRGTASEELKAMADYAAVFCEARKEGSIDVKKTHLSYLSDILERNFDKLFKPNIFIDFDERRMALMKNLREEMNERIENKQVTYEWWFDFNVRLSDLLSGPGTFNLRFENYDKIDYFIYPTCLAELKIEDMNKIFSTHLVPIGLSNHPLFVDGQLMEPNKFFEHDLAHFLDISGMIDFSKIPFQKYSLDDFEQISKKYDFMLEYLRDQGIHEHSSLSQLLNGIYFFCWHEQKAYISDLYKISKNDMDRLYNRDLGSELIESGFLKRNDYYKGMFPDPSSLGFASVYQMLNYGKEYLQVFFESKNSQEASEKIAALNQRVEKEKLKTNVDHLALENADVKLVSLNQYVTLTKMELDLYNDLVNRLNSSDYNNLKEIIEMAEPYPNVQRLLTS